MKKFLLTLAVVALASSAMMAQTNSTTQEEPDRIQMRHLSMNPTGNDIPTGYDAPQVVNQKKHECKDHKDGQPCTKPADQQCDDCKAKAAAPKHECKEGKKECKEGMKHECKEGKKECKEGMKHECKEGKHECKDGKKECKEGMKHECKDGKKECKEGMKHECKDGMKKHECKDHKDGQPCTKPADQQCPDCKEKAKKD